MKYLFLIFLATLTLNAELKADTVIPRSFHFDKIMVFNHSYIVINETILGAQNQIIHDPDCRCMKFTEEQIAKVVQEVIRLKDNQKTEKN